MRYSDEKQNARRVEAGRRSAEFYPRCMGDVYRKNECFASRKSAARAQKFSFYRVNFTTWFVRADSKPHSMTRMTLRIWACVTVCSALPSTASMRFS